MAITFRVLFCAPMEGKGWPFVTQPNSAGGRLPTHGALRLREQSTGSKSDHLAFPDGDGSHNIQVNTRMRAGAKGGSKLLGTPGSRQTRQILRRHADETCTRAVNLGN